MNPTDEQIERLITDCRLMGQALIADGQEMRAAHVLNARLSLCWALSDERKTAVAQADLERAERLRAGL